MPPDLKIKHEKQREQTFEMLLDLYHCRQQKEEAHTHKTEDSLYVTNARS